MNDFKILLRLQRLGLFKMNDFKILLRLQRLGLFKNEWGHLTYIHTIMNQYLNMSVLFVWFFLYVNLELELVQK